MKRSAAILALLCILIPSTFAQQTQPSSPQSQQTAQPKAPTPQTSITAEGNPEVRVWVNTNSGVYHCPGTHWYGATKSGSYMKQSEAQQKGFRPAYHRACK